jgi:hypothetical protein
MEVIYLVITGSVDLDADAKTAEERCGKSRDLDMLIGL